MFIFNNQVWQWFMKLCQTWYLTLIWLYSSQLQQPSAHNLASKNSNAALQSPQVQKTQTIVPLQEAHKIHGPFFSVWLSVGARFLNSNLNLSSVSFTGSPLEAKATVAQNANAKSKNIFFISGINLNEMPTLFAFRRSRPTSFGVVSGKPTVATCGQNSYPALQ